MPDPDHEPLTESDEQHRKYLSLLITGSYYEKVPMPDPDHEPLFKSWAVDTPIDQIIGEAIGAASACWQHPERAGVFDAERASRIVDEVMTALRRKLWADDNVIHVPVGLDRLLDSHCRKDRR